MNDVFETGKEVLQSYLLQWKKLVAADDSAPAIRHHLESFLTQSDTCRCLLDKLMANFIQARIVEAELQLIFKSQYARPAKIRLAPPYDKAVDGYPASFMALIRVHNGISWEAGGSGYFGFGGFFYDADENEVRFNSSGFDSSYIEDGDNASFIAALDDKGLSVEDVISPIDYGKNWIIWNPSRNNKLKEPQLCFVSHEDGEVVPIKKAASLSFGAFFLRVMYMSIVDYKSGVLDTVYS